MSFEKCCNFYPNFKFCAVKKYYKYLQQYCTEIGEDFRKYEKTRVKREETKIRH